MTKQQSESKVLLPHEEPITPELILRGYTATENIINQLKQQADDTGIQIPRNQFNSRTGIMSSGVPRKLSEVHFNYRDMDKEKTQKFINQVVHPKTRKFITLNDLIQRNEISEEERPLYDQYFPEGLYTDFPVRIIHQYHRVKQDKKEYLWTNEEFRGVTSKGAVVSRTATLYTYTIPNTKIEVVDNNGNVIGSNQSTDDTITAISAIIYFTFLFVFIICQKYRLLL